MRPDAVVLPDGHRLPGRLEDLGLVVSTTHQRGKVKTYYVSDPPAVGGMVVGRLEVPFRLSPTRLLPNLCPPCLLWRNAGLSS